MKKKEIINVPKISDILKEEFMVPYGLTAYGLAKAIGVPTSRIQDILHDRRKITAETSIRLGKYFGLSDKYFLNLQNDIDIREAKTIYENSINAISPLVAQ
ncbi:MAG: HigA family addiction module antidote protein [Bacilli bacterium]|nr:HigA family addiction module antidote protein [Bacilli bacterium]